MKNLIFLLVASIVFSCQKTEPVNANSRVDATITSSSGEIKQFSARGSSVVFACAIFGGSYIQADQSPTYLGLSIGGYSYMKCISGTGRYDLICTYYPRNKFSSSQIYQGTTYGGITITAFKGSGKYAEGYFDIVCPISQQGTSQATDSVRVTGTFSSYVN